MFTSRDNKLCKFTVVVEKSQQNWKSQWQINHPPSSSKICKFSNLLWAVLLLESRFPGFRDKFTNSSRNSGICKIYIPVGY